MAMQREHEPDLSGRGEDLLARPPTPPYLREHFARRGDPWHPERNPGGYVAMCVAENKLLADLLLPKMAECRDVPPEVLGYDDMVGSLPFRRRLARFMGRSFLGRTFDPDQIAVLAGAGSVLEALFYAIGDPGDGVLVPTPSYAGFWADLTTRNALTIVPAHCAGDRSFRVTTSVLDEALARAGCPVKALLFTSPSNPLGRVYGREEILEVAAWAGSRGLHVVFDEIYALSAFGPAAFVSAADVLPSLGESVHLVWAFSKDFGASGLRCGVLVSENQRLLEAVNGLAYWACCSGDTQHLLGRMIEDDTWADSFVRESRDRVREAHRRVAAALEEQGIPVLPADAGIFVLCDLRSFMTEPSWEAEDVLWWHILEEANVNLTPGSACHVGEPGFMRLCYAAEPTDAVIAGIRRVGALLRAG